MNLSKIEQTPSRQGERGKLTRLPILAATWASTTALLLQILLSHINIPMAGRSAATSENENRVADGHEIASVMVARPRTLI